MGLENRDTEGDGEFATGAVEGLLERDKGAGGDFNVEEMDGIGADAGVDGPPRPVFSCLPGTDDVDSRFVK